MVTAQTAEASRCRCAVTEGTGLKPSTVSKKIYFRKQSGNKVASDLELGRKKKLSEFVQLFKFPDFVGVPPRIPQARHFSAILKIIPFNYGMRLDPSRTPNERKAKPVL